MPNPKTPYQPMWDYREWDSVREVARQQANAILRARVARGELAAGAWTSDYEFRTHDIQLQCQACRRTYQFQRYFLRGLEGVTYSVGHFLDHFRQAEAVIANDDVEHNRCGGMAVLLSAPSAAVLELAELELLAGE